MRAESVWTQRRLTGCRCGSGRFLLLLALIAAIGGPAAAQPIGLVSVADPSRGPAAGGGGDSVAPILSTDGRYVLFSSTANNLALTSSNTPFSTAWPPRLNVFLRDPNKTTLVSINRSGTGGGNGDSVGTDLSKYGRHALFESRASDLVASETNDCSDVFRRDMVAGTTRLVSAGRNGAAANGASRESLMTPNGRHVAFVSEASNLVPDDTNGIADVFMLDTQSSSMTLVSAGATATNPAVASAGSSSPDLTPDGRYVAFCSAATNLVPGVPSAGDIYVRDLVAGVTHWASVDARACLAAVLGAANSTNAVICHPMISEDGRYVVFRASPGITSSLATTGLILRYSLGTGLTEIVCTNANVVAATAADEVRSMDMTPDGEFITFVANTNSTKGTTYIGVWDALTGETVLASGDLGNAPGYGTMVCWPTIDPTGRFVAFLSPVTNWLAPHLIPGRPYHLYVRDLQAGTTKVVDTDTSGAACGVSSTALSRLSAGGQYIAFEAPDGSLVPGDWNRAEDVFLRDLVTSTTKLVSARAPSLPSLSPNSSTTGWPLSASADGRYVAFTSEADNLVPNDTNKCQDVFVRDLAAGVIYLVSARTNTLTPGEGSSLEPSISADGRYVAFTSYATNLIVGDANKARDVFVRDLLTGATTLVSVTTNVSGPGNGDSHTPAISADGQRVLFFSTAKDLAPGPYASQSENLFYRDLQSGTTRTLTGYGVRSAAMTPDGRWVAFAGALTTSLTNLYLWDSQSATRVYTNTGSAFGQVSLSRDGSRLAYTVSSALYATDWQTRTVWSVGTMAPSSRAGLTFSADGRFLVYASTSAQLLVDTNATYDVYLYDLQTSTKVLVSQSLGFASAANDASDCPDISPDGRFVAYRSAASNLVPGDVNGVGDVFIYDRVARTTTLLSLSRGGTGPANYWSFRPLFTSEGRQVLFQSWASDLVGFDFNQGGDVFAYAMFYAQIIPGDSPAHPPMLSWPVVPGKTYRVQFRDQLGLMTWQEAGGTVTIVGDTAYFTDPAPGATQRFYRVIAN